MFKSTLQHLNWRAFDMVAATGCTSPDYQLRILVDSTSATRNDPDWQPTYCIEYGHKSGSTEHPWASSGHCLDPDDALEKLQPALLQLSVRINVAD